jgi:predicted nucleic acid-binding protein
MLIVADTTPIISLIKVGLLELLNGMYGEIILPEAVFNELVSNPLMIDEANIVKKSSF